MGATLSLPMFLVCTLLLGRHSTGSRAAPTMPRMNNTRRLSMSKARSLAMQVAEDFARHGGWEGALLSAEPDARAADHRGRTPVQWMVAFSTVLRGVEYDGPRLVRVDIENGTAHETPDP
ncbi:hypothetical protein GCM10007918_34000 [Piscinibacter gummiphilus]|nr:hypothetical protein GCM10007918_34000 [Piscinibacter gummiphilus]